MINTILAYTLLVATIIWVVIIMRSSGKEEKVWNVVDFLKVSLDVKDSKVRQLEAALVDMSKVLKETAKRHEAEVDQLRKEHSAANKAFGERYEEVQKLNRDVKGLNSIIERQRGELKERNEIISKLESELEEIRRGCEACCKCPEGARPKYTFSYGSFFCLCSGKKMVPVELEPVAKEEVAS